MSNGIGFKEAQTSIIFEGRDFSRGKFLQERFRSIGFIHLEFTFAGNIQSDSAVLSSDLSFVSLKVSRVGV